jgi:hypothetical protein
MKYTRCDNCEKEIASMDETNMVRIYGLSGIATIGAEFEICRECAMSEMKLKDLLK